jgi:isopenicillin N synthase-like dioxygenase
MAKPKRVLDRLVAASTAPTPDTATLRAAVEAHKDGSDKFTRRMAINIADFFGLQPMALVWQLEKRGIIKRGSYQWFKNNGGITRAHVAEVRADREADRQAITQFLEPRP